MGQYAEKTSVPADRSRAEIERTLTRYGADGFAYGWEGTIAVIAFRAHNRRIQFRLPLPDRDDPAFTQHSQGYRTEAAARSAYEQAVRQRWRAMALVIKAKLEAVETGIVDFESEFLAHILLPDGQTTGDWLLPQVAQAYETGEMPSLLPGGQPALTAGE